MTILGWLFIFLGIVVLGVVVAVFIWKDSLQLIGDWDKDWDED